MALFSRKAPQDLLWCRQGRQTTATLFGTSADFPTKSARKKIFKSQKCEPKVGRVKSLEEFFGSQNFDILSETWRHFIILSASICIPSCYDIEGPGHITLPAPPPETHLQGELLRWRPRNHRTVDGRNPSNPLRLVVYPIVWKVFYLPGGCWGFLPSTVSGKMFMNGHFLWDGWFVCRRALIIREISPVKTLFLAAFLR